MKKFELQLETLSCPSCVNRIEGTLNKTKGVQNARVLFHSSKVKASFDETTISLDSIANLVEKLGFAVKNKKSA